MSLQKRTVSSVVSSNCVEINVSYYFHSWATESQNVDHDSTMIDYVLSLTYVDAVIGNDLDFRFDLYEWRENATCLCSIGHSPRCFSIVRRWSTSSISTARVVTITRLGTIASTTIAHLNVSPWHQSITTIVSTYTVANTCVSTPTSILSWCCLGEFDNQSTTSMATAMFLSLSALEVEEDKRMLIWGWELSNA